MAPSSQPPAREAAAEDATLTHNHAAVRPSLQGRSPLPTLSGLSLQARLLAIVILLLLVAQAASSLTSLILLRSNLSGQVDEELQAKADVVIGAALSRLRRDDADALLLSDYYVQFSALDGTTPRVTCQRDANQDCLRAPTLPRMTTAAVHAHAGTPFTVPDADGGDDWRVIIRSAADYPINVAVALPLSGTSQTVDDFQAVSLLGGAVVILLGAALATVAIRRSFRPLQSIERTASAIAAGDLTQRVPTTAASTEVGRLSNALNAMLSQIEQAFIARQRVDDQMRRFVADASHELRTPLTAIRGFAELHRLGAVSKADDVAHVMGRIEAESTRLGVLVEDLLALARLEERQRQQQREYEIVDLAVLASDAVHDARVLAPQRSVRLVGLRDNTGPGPAPVLGQDGSLRQVLTNLLANAMHHTPPTTPIEVAVGRIDTPTGAEAVVEVRDHGPGLTLEQSEKVFERFYRVDDSRQRGAGGGSGLGLTIVSTIIDHHEGSIRVVPTPSGGATFQLRFRAQDPPT